jgi:hypothetical protein
MALADELRQRARATWAAGDWDGFSRLVAPVGARALDCAGVDHYADDFGPFVMARGVLEPQGRWHEFLTAFSELVARFNAADDGRATIRSEYLVINVER